MATAADAVATMVRFDETVKPVPEWTELYRRGRGAFEARLNG